VLFFVLVFFFFFFSYLRATQNTYSKLKIRSLGLIVRKKFPLFQESVFLRVEKNIIGKKNKMSSPQVTTGQRPSTTTGLKKVSEHSVERRRSGLLQTPANNINNNNTGGIRASSKTNKIPPSSSSSSLPAISKPTPEHEFWATLIDAVTSAFQNRAPTLILPTTATSVKFLETDEKMKSFYSLAKESLEAFASLELSTSATEKSRVSSKHNDTGSYSTTVVASLGETAGIVENKTKLLGDQMRILLKTVYSTSTSSASSNTVTKSALLTRNTPSQQQQQQLPPSFKKSVATSLQQGIDAVDEVRLAAQAIHNIRKTILSRDLEAAQKLLMEQSASEQQQVATTSSSFLPSLLLRWLRRNWVPAMKVWNELTNRFTEESQRYFLKQNNIKLKLHTEDDALAILTELIKKYRSEAMKKSAELLPITLPGQGVEQLVYECFEEPLSKHLNLLKKRAKLLGIFREGVETLDMVALSQAVKEWKRDVLMMIPHEPSAANNNNNKKQSSADETTNNGNATNELYLEAKKTVERLQNLGRITAGLTMAKNKFNNVSQQQESSTAAANNNNSNISFDILKDLVSALHQTSTLIMNEHWYQSETQCAMVVAFGEKLLNRNSKSLEILEKALMKQATINSGEDNSSQQQQQQPKDVSFHRDRLQQHLVAQISSKNSAKFWPVELTKLYCDVAEIVINKIHRKFLHEAVVNLSKKISENANSENNSNQQQQLLLITEAKSLIDKLNSFDNNKNSNATATAQLLLLPKSVQEALSNLTKAISENSSKTVKVHYDSNLRLVHLEDSFSFAKSMNDILTSLEIDGKLIAEKGPIRVRVADDEGDFITVVSQKEWDLMLKDFTLGTTTANNSNSNGPKKLELYLDHFRIMLQQQQTPNAQQQQNGKSPVPNTNATNQQQIVITPPPQQQKNVFTTSNANNNNKQHQQTPTSGKLILGSPKLQLGANNNNNYQRPTSSSNNKQAVSAVQSLAIEGKNAATPAFQFQQVIQQNQTVVVDNITSDDSASQIGGNTYFSPPGGRPPMPEQFPARVLEHAFGGNNNNNQKKSPAVAKGTSPAVLTKKLQDARNKKNINEKEEYLEDDDDEEPNPVPPVVPISLGFWAKNLPQQQQQAKSDQNPPQKFEFDLMTVASDSTAATNFTTATAQQQMAALAKAKWGNGGGGGLDAALLKQLMMAQQQQSNNVDFDLKTVMSEATNGFHIEDHLELLMGKGYQQGKQQRAAAISSKEIQLELGGKKAPAPTATANQNNKLPPSNTHNRIFGSSHANSSPFGAKKKNDNNNDLVIQGRNNK
jgi:hypothetical protein